MYIGKKNDCQQTDKLVQPIVAGKNKKGHGSARTFLLAAYLISAAFLPPALAGIMATLIAQPAVAQPAMPVSPYGQIPGLMPAPQNAPTYPISRENLNVYYATTRLNDNPGGRPVYGGARHLDFGEGSTEFGTALVARPAGYATISHARDWMELRGQMSAADNFFAFAPIRELNRESQTQFSDRIRNFHGLIVIYVHGYDMPFATALREIAELVEEFKARSPAQSILPIAFSWPSPGNKADYSGDEASLEWSEKPFRELIKLINQNKPADTSVDLLAHSMGSRYAFAFARSQWPGEEKAPDQTQKQNPGRGINQMPVQNETTYPDTAQDADADGKGAAGPYDGSGNKTVFRNIYLSCSDVDYHTAEALRDGLQRCAGKLVYVFVNDNDGALFTSQMLHQAPRLGRPIDPGDGGSSANLANAAGDNGQGKGQGGILVEAENMLSSKAAALFGQKAKSFVQELTSGAETVFTRPSQVSPEQSPEVTAWLARDPYLSRDWGPKVRLIDTTGFITLNMGHRLAWPLLVGLMMDPPSDSPFTFAAINKRPDKAMLKGMGGTPTYLYRYDRIDLSHLKH